MKCIIVIDFTLGVCRIRNGSDIIQSKKIALIPAYKPTFSMIDLLKELTKEKFEIVIVNDGSGNEYDEIFKESEKYAIILKHENNKGKGIALKTGLKYISENFLGDYVVVTMDCDGQHTVKDAEKLVENVNDNMLVLGKRIRSDKTPLRSKFGNSVTRFVYRLITGVDVYDTQTGLRAFKNDLIDFLLKVEGKRYEYEMNVLLECYKNNIPIKETQIETIYIDNNSHSHFDTFKDSLLVYKEIIKFTMSSLISFLVDYLCYSLVIILSSNIILANIFARVISSVVNYNINKKVVFKSSEKGLISAVKYFVLVLIVLILNTNILKLLVEHLFINKFLAKIITEVILFVLSLFIQKKFIFKNREKEI